ncbi:hypothetical protein A9K65_013420 [Mesorhizobium sp. WSM1497]|uniref:DUF2971 domain-containing protein n=1 Tax=Mesorhizobium sp. WSM1497 TaxID=278153 RepID=UPI0007EC7D30|nr:DUF2971 domain-containing protein [Mesorhizobium sp. WSM1497]ARP64270.1 hypothetical protein A9K65_013420 [Mesorhizobium sp. WSM1497]
MSADAEAIPTRGLLKFCGPTSYALENLRNGVLYCQHYEGFNDPFEFWADIETGIPDPVTARDRFIAAATAWGFERFEDAVSENATEYFEGLDGSEPPFERMLDKMRIACFASETDNLPMWSHYADGLRGFCIVFDEAAVINVKPEAFILDVAYQDVPPRVDTFVYAVAYDQEDYHAMAIEETESEIKRGDTSSEVWLEPYKGALEEALVTMRGMWKDVFATKPSEWKYENERRLLTDALREGKEPVLRPYPPEAVKEIIIGERMPAGYRDRLLEIIRARLGDRPVRTARRSTDRYAIFIDDPIVK